MKKSLFLLIISISTFCFGVLTAPNSYKQVSLEEITQNCKYYDGKRVEIITYAQIFRVDEESIIIGEPFEKNEIITFLDLEENSINLAALQKQLTEDYSINKFKRVKVRVIGKVFNNCKEVTCCFGKSFKIIAESIEQIGQIEDYTVPLPFQLNKSESNSQ